MYAEKNFKKVIGGVILISALFSLYWDFNDYFLKKTKKNQENLEKFKILPSMSFFVIFSCIHSRNFMSLASF